MLGTTYIIEACVEAGLNVGVAHVVIAGDGDERDSVVKLSCWDDPVVD